MTKDISIFESEDIKREFRNLAKREYNLPPVRTNYSYGYPSVVDGEARSIGSDGFPDTQVIRPIRSLLEVNEFLNRNLNYMSSEEDWRRFYCFPGKREIREATENLGYPEKKIANQNPASSTEFRKLIISNAQKAIPNRESQFVFLSGTTGVGKTTFVKYHAKTEKTAYLENSVIISRVRFGDVETAIFQHGSNGDHLHATSALEQHIINCLVRDIIESYRVSKSNTGNENLHRNLYHLESSISEAEQKILLLKEHENEYSSYVKDFTTFNKIEEADFGEISEISLEIKISLIESVSDNFNFVYFLDGFDAIQPENVYLDEHDDHAVFLRCLESVITGRFGGSGPVHTLFSKVPTVFCISVRKITIAQLRLCLPAEVLFDQIVADEWFVAASDIYKIVELRCQVRSIERKLSINKPQIDTLIEAMKKCLTFIRSDFGIAPNQRIISLFNYNVREKLTFLRDVTDFLLKQTANLIHTDNRARADLERTGSLQKFIRDLDLRKLNVEPYEFEKILILNNRGRFANYFLYDISRKSLVQVDNRGAFDNIFNYRRSDFEQSNESTKYCSLLVKYHILKKIEEEPGISYDDCSIWLDEYLGKDVWSNLDFKILIRSWLIDASFVDGEIRYTLTEKGAFLKNKLLFRYSFFERAIMAARLPRFIRSRMMKPEEASGGQWGRTSIINSALFISYIRAVEEAQNIPEADRIADRLIEAFVDVVGGIANKGLTEYSDYALDIRRGFMHAFSEN